MSEPDAMHMNSQLTGLSIGAEKHHCYGADGVLKDSIDGHADEGRSHSGGDDKLEPIAVIGMALKFPQDATTPEAFWEMMLNGKSARSDVPSERFDINGFYSSFGAKDGQLNVRGGHFVKDDVAAFDAPFFSITPEEASCMDPMQRWLLETAYKALEDAGISIEKASGSQASVFVGALTSDYHSMLTRDPQQRRKYRAVGNSLAILANRLSWFYKFTGPSMTIDTACSSSLTALHLACHSLRSGESNMALVGGCNLWIDPDGAAGMTDLNVLSPDSTCYSFDHRANGYSRGEGIGVVVLKPLSKALTEGDTIRAVIRATGVSHNGWTPGITQPSSEAQLRMIKDTYHAGGLDMKETRFVEAHGTGTSLGDPLEAAAIGSAFEDSARREPIFVGAVKTNIGHLEGASGLASVIKTILVLEKGIIPPNVWFEHVNPRIDIEGLKIKFPFEPTPWPTNGLRRASINSAGFGGAIAHVVLDDAYNYLGLRNLQGRHNTRKGPPTIESLTAARNQGTNGKDGKNKQAGIQKALCKAQPKLLVWSAAESDGLKRLCRAYLVYLRAVSPCEVNDSYLADLAWTLSEKRSRLPWKSFAVAHSITDLRHTLESAPPKGSRSNQAPRVCFVFTGQGAQWCDMGRELLVYPVFSESLKTADAFLRGLGCSWSLLNELLRNEQHSNFGNAVYDQPICSALQIALVELLQSWGVTPTAVIGHSSGEIAAGYCVGGISRESAWKIAYYRGQVTASLTSSGKSSGSMLSVGVSEAKIEEYLNQVDKNDGELTVGCINSPRNVTVAGSVDLLASLQKLLEEDDVFVRRLRVSVAYHSKQMNEIAPVYDSLLGRISGGTPIQGGPVMFSSVSGSKVLGEDLSKSEYWVENLVSPVKFLQALANISPKAQAKVDRVGYADLQLNYVLEIGPHSALKGPISEYISTTSQPSEIIYDSVLVRRKSALCTMMTALGTLHCLGYPLDVARVNDSKQSITSRRMLLNLPSYPFNYSKKYWAEGRVSKSYRFRAMPHHELLGTPVSDWNPLNARWQNIIRISENTWIKDHIVTGTVIYPAAGMLTMAIEAARQLSNTTSKPRAYHLKQVIIHKALSVPSGDAGVETQLHLRPSKERGDRFPSWSEFQLYAFENDAWSEICQGYIAIEFDESSDSLGESTALSALPQEIFETYQRGADRCKFVWPHESLYRFLHTHGLTYGPTFRGLRNIRFNDVGEATATTDLQAWMDGTSDADIQPHVIHPAALDTVFQTIHPAMSRGGRKSIPTILPTAISFLSLFVGGNTAYISGSTAINKTNDVRMHATSKPQGLRNTEFSITALHTESSQPLLSAKIECAAIAGTEAQLSNRSTGEGLFYHMDWKPDLDLLDSGSVSSWCSSAACEPVNVSNLMVGEKEQICISALQELKNAKLVQGFMEDRPHLQRYRKWVDHHLTWPRSKEVTTPSVGWHRPITDESASPELYAKVERSDPEGKLIVKVARNLMKVMIGEIDPLQLLFEDNIMSDYYEYLHQQSKAFRGILLYVDALAHKRPNLKFLEIGAGTGGATRGILNLLTHDVATNSANPRFAEYVFTDVSAQFLEKARYTFGHSQGRVTFATLDIEQDLVDQGFTGNKYDVVVASNVLHATKDLKSTLQNTRRLLKPGGKLLLIETTVFDQVTLGFIFGLLPGWWLGTEENRILGPLVTRACWHAYLSSCGFSGIDIVLPIQEEARDSSIIVSTALEAADADSANPGDIARSQGPESNGVLPSVSKVIILVDPDSQLQLNTASQLIAKKPSMPSLEFEILALPVTTPGTLDQATCIFLPEFERPFLYGITCKEFEACQHMVSSVNRLLWVTRAPDAGPDPARAMVTGLARCLARENPKRMFVTLGLQKAQDMTSAIENMSKVLQKMMLANQDSLETEYMEIDGRLCINRLLHTESLDRHIAQKTGQQHADLALLYEDPSRRLGLTMGSPGLLDTLEFSDIADHEPSPSGYLEIEVKAAGLNFRDVLIALGYSVGDKLGFECSGVVTQVSGPANFHIGDRVSCIVEGAIATSVKCEAYAAFRLPESMTFATAAAFPVIFLTAYYSIIRMARIQAGESILIHSAAGGFGQACIQTARLVNAEIYATVGTKEKKSLLIDVYGVKEDHIFSSRSSNFVAGIRRLTMGRGVDVIVNSLAGEALKSTWECIAPFGRFIEVGKADTSSSTLLPMLPFSRGASFIGVDLVHLRNSDSAFRKILEETMNLVAEGKFTAPTPLRVYDASQLESAFRLLESGNSTGKMVVTFGNDDVVNIVASKLPATKFDENSSYIIAGGLGGLGRSIARWMVSRNAKNLILLSRTKAHGEDVGTLLRELKEKGVNVATPACDIGDREALVLALESCRSMPKVKGCIQAAMVLQDDLFKNMSFEDFQAAIKPKVDGSWNLHTLLPTKMDFFILLSSVSGILGLAGQANYACGNTYQDALVQHRIAHKEKAISLDLCSIESVGFVAEFGDIAKLLIPQGISSLAEDELLALLDYHCNPAFPLPSIMRSQVVVGIRAPDASKTELSDGESIFNRPMFRILRQAGYHQSVSTSPELESVTDFTSLIRVAKTLAEAADVVVDSVRTKLSSILAIEKENVDPGRTIADYGIDSLSGVELRTWFRNVVGAEVTTFEIQGNKSINALSLALAAKSRYVDASLKEGED